ncbi:hypothetical protein HGA91_03770 [candidate division WWE3 bacterium]|nr:hypothetical protein [candidate division WWE3 bacterium]
MTATVLVDNASRVWPFELAESDIECDVGCCLNIAHAFFVRCLGAQIVVPIAEREGQAISVIQLPDGQRLVLTPRCSCEFVTTSWRTPDPQLLIVELNDPRHAWVRIVEWTTAVFGNTNHEHGGNHEQTYDWQDLPGDAFEIAIYPLMNRKLVLVPARGGATC